MEKFAKPDKLNGEQLVDELKAVGIKIEDWPLVDGDGDLILDIPSKDKDKAAEIIKSHIGLDLDKSAILAAKKQAVLDKLGLTEEEIKFLLS